MSRPSLTNESGTYNFPSLLPGTYKLSATLPGFRPHIYNDVKLGANTAARYNFTLEVGGLTQAVEVSADRTAVLAETSATIGQVLTENMVRDLPLVTNDVLDLLKTMPGVRGEANAGTFAGISTSYVNTTRDGISVTENRYINGVSSTTLINPDLVGEMRVILTPVDAETGRGNGQVQILTRSGTNRFKGVRYGPFETRPSMPTPGATTATVGLMATGPQRSRIGPTGIRRRSATAARS